MKPDLIRTVEDEAATEAEPLVVIDDVYKSFVVSDKRPASPTLPGNWNRFRRKKQQIEVLKGVSFTLSKGESVSLIGRNGAGKSTLLMLIARIYRPTKGEVSVKGRIAPLLELGAGFHPDLTGRDNVIFNGMLLGLSRDEINSHLAEIIEFADIGDYIDRPARTYSSGMQARLGFSVAIHTNPEILIVDEVLSVGDLSFARKCEEKVSEFKESGGTILLVSHELETIRRVADRVVWLESGRVHEDGPAEAVLPRYLKFMGAIDVLEETEAHVHSHPLPSEQDREINAGHAPVHYLIDQPFAMGQSFRAAIYHSIPQSEVQQIYRAPEPCTLGEILKEPLRKSVRIVSGQFSSSLGAVLGTPGRISGVFRDPLGHAAAMYEWERSVTGAAFHTLAKEMTFGEFYDANLSPVFENPTTKLLAGAIFLNRYWYEEAWVKDEELLERALAKIPELEFIGITPELNESIDGLSELLGCTITIDAGATNIGSEVLAEVSQEDKERTLGHFQLDLRVYEAIVKERARRSEAGST